MRFAPFLATATILAACSADPAPGDAVAWAINWGTVTPTVSGLEGYQVWEFFHEGWEQRHSQDLFACHMVQAVSSQEVSCPDSVPGCRGAYSLELELADTDCEASLANDQSYLGPSQVAVGDLPADLEDDAPYAEHVLGWYTSWREGTFLPHGYAYPEALEEGGTAPRIPWTMGEPHILWPAYAWEL